MMEHELQKTSKHCPTIKRDACNLAFGPEPSLQHLQVWRDEDIACCEADKIHRKKSVVSRTRYLHVLTTVEESYIYIMSRTFVHHKPCDGLFNALGKPKHHQGVQIGFLTSVLKRIGRCLTSPNSDDSSAITR